MPASEYLGWSDYHARIPFQDNKIEFLLAELIALTANINRDPDKAPFGIDEFMPWLKEPEKIEHLEPQATTMQTKKQLAVINHGMEMFLHKLSKVN